jgi:hypothetical protein
MRCSRVTGGPTKSGSSLRTPLDGFGNGWRNVDDVELATQGYVDWFNNRRLLEPVGDIPPAEKEAD